MTDQTRGLTSGVYTVTPDASVRQAAELMQAQGVGDVIVVEHHRPVGILTDRDIVIRVTAAGLNPRDVSVQEVMSSPLITAMEQGEVSDAIALMQRHGIRRLPILDHDGRLCSILTLDDLLMLGIGQEQLGNIIHRQLRGIQREGLPADGASVGREVRPSAAAIATIARAGVEPPLGKHKTWLSPAIHRILRRNRQWFILVAVLSLLAAAVALILGYVLTPPSYLE